MAGCLLGLGLLAAPALIVAGAFVFAYASLDASAAAKALSLRAGPRHGADGWYIGERGGHSVGLGIVVRAGGTARVRSQAHPEGVVVVCSHAARNAAGAVWREGKGTGPAASLPGAEAAAAFAGRFGELSIRDDAATQLVCGERVGVVHRWGASTPSPAGGGGASRCLDCGGLWAMTQPLRVVTADLL